MMKSEVKPLTVLEKWILDVKEMEATTAKLKKSFEAYKEESRKRVDALNKKASAYRAEFSKKIKEMEATTAKLKEAFDIYATEFKKTVQRMVAHIWGVYVVKE